MDSANLLDDGKGDADTMTPSADRRVDIHGEAHDSMSAGCL